MFQVFLRARSHKSLRDRLRGERAFRARSPDRDAETDRLRIEAVIAAIDDVLEDAQREQSGLNRRVEEVLARAAVTLGNGDDEHLDRDPLDSHHQDLFDNEIKNGQRRLSELEFSISHYKVVKTTLLNGFPNYQPPAGPVQGAD